MLIDAAFVGLLHLANIASIAAVGGITNNARQAVNWHPILESTPRTYGILSFGGNTLGYISHLLGSLVTNPKYYNGLGKVEVQILIFP